MVPSCWSRTFLDSGFITHKSQVPVWIVSKQIPKWTGMPDRFPGGTAHKGCVIQKYNTVRLLKAYHRSLWMLRIMLPFYVKIVTMRSASKIRMIVLTTSHIYDKNTFTVQSYRTKYLNCYGLLGGKWEKRFKYSAMVLGARLQSRWKLLEKRRWLMGSRLRHRFGLYVGKVFRQDSSNWRVSAVSQDSRSWTALWIWNRNSF